MSDSIYYSLNSPQYFDIISDLEDLEDDKENVELEPHNDSVHDNNNLLKVENDEFSLEYFSPMINTPGKCLRPLRKRISISMNDLFLADRVTSSKDFSESDKLVKHSSSSKTHLICPHNNSQSTLMENICRLAKPKKRCNKDAYIPIKEAINNFWSHTPERYHSKLKNCQFKKPNSMLPPKNINGIELDETKKSKKQTNFTKSKIVQNSVQPDAIFKKPTTTKPSKLADNHSKKLTKKGNNVPPKSVTQVVPFSFNKRDLDIRKKKADNLVKCKCVPIMSSKGNYTRPIPFSFEERDKLKLEKRNISVDKEGRKKGEGFQTKLIRVKNKSHLDSTSLGSNSNVVPYQKSLKSNSLKENIQ